MLEEKETAVENTDVPEKGQETVVKSKTVKKSAKKSSTKKKRSGNIRNTGAKSATPKSIGQQVKYPRHSVRKALRIPAAILEQNAGKDCTDKEAVAFLGINLTGEMRTEVSSAIKYGLLKRSSAGRVELTDLARKILRPQHTNDTIDGVREAVLKAPDISDVYQHYRGENLPDPQFFDNALGDTFHIPESKLSEFKRIFIEVLREAELIEEHNEKLRILDISVDDSVSGPGADVIKKLSKAVSLAQPIVVL